MEKLFLEDYVSLTPIIGRHIENAPFLRKSLCFVLNEPPLSVKQDTQPLQKDITSGFLFQLPIKANKVCYLGRS